MQMSHSFADVYSRLSLTQERQIDPGDRLIYMAVTGRLSFTYPLAKWSTGRPVFYH